MNNRNQRTSTPTLQLPTRNVISNVVNSAGINHLNGIMIIGDK